MKKIVLTVGLLLVSACATTQTPEPNSAVTRLGAIGERLLIQALSPETVGRAVMAQDSGWVDLNLTIRITFPDSIPLPGPVDPIRFEMPRPGDIDICWESSKGLSDYVECLLGDVLDQESLGGPEVEIFGDASCNYLWNAYRFAMNPIQQAYYMNLLAASGCLIPALDITESAGVVLLLPTME